MELRTRPKSNYLHQAKWEELFVLAEHWKSDMEFCHDELTFLGSLVDKYHSSLINKEGIAQMKLISDKLSKAHGKQKEIVDKIDKHLIHLEDLMENPFSHDEQQFRDEHAFLEDHIADFIKEFRSIKNEIFTITKGVIRDEKFQHLLAK